MKLKTIRKNRIIATLQGLGMGSGYGHGETFEIDAATAIKEIERSPYSPRMWLDEDRGVCSVHFHSNRFYNFKAAQS